MNRKDFYDFTPLSHPTGATFIVGAERSQGLPEWAAREGYVVSGETPLNDEFKLIEVKRAQDPHR